MKKTIITVVGKDKVGIIASICSFLADSSVNVCDISQTIVNGFFNMMMVVDLSSSTKSFKELCEEGQKLGESLGVVVQMQKEEIFDLMHRI